LSLELVEAVVDFDELGEVLGVEILGLIFRHPDLARHLENLREVGGEVVPSFDPEADALYLRFRHGRSRDQLVKQAALLLGPEHELVTVVVDIQ
jgi:uncharacterized protein YuzE